MSFQNPNTRPEVLEPPPPSKKALPRVSVYRVYKNAPRFKCGVAPAPHCCHLDSRSAATGLGVDLLSTPSFAAYSLSCSSSMPRPPTKSTMDNLTAARQKVGPPSALGAIPRSYFLKQMRDFQRMDMFNGIFSLYLNGRLFKQKSVRDEFWTEDPTTLTELLTKDGQWYDQHFRKVPKMITMLLRHSDDQQIRFLRRSRIQGDIVLIDFLQMDVMKRNFPTLCPASLWAMAHCMEKKRFTFGAETGTANLRGNPYFMLGFNGYLVEKRVDPATVELKSFLCDHQRDP